VKNVSCLLPAGLILLAGCTNSHLVTGNDGQTSGATQSETSATKSYVGGTNRLTVSYNDETNEGQFISYTASDRVLSKGASLMGWSYSDNAGASWTYGGKLSPPKNWSVLWGDPAITTSGAAYNTVFLSNLAVPDSKFPAGGIHGYVYYGDGKESYIGGACIARSTDGGKTFSIYQCVDNKQPIADVPDSSQGHFYDGGSMASNGAGEIFAAYVDVAAGNIDVWRSPSANSQFAPIANPFPNSYAISHPILRTSRDNSLYVAANLVGPSGYQLWINRYANGAWGNPVQITPNMVVYPGIDFGTTLQGSELTIRTGQQFSYDIGAASEGGNDAVRILFVLADQKGHLFIDAAACNANLTTCGEVPGWRFQGGGPGNSAVDTFNPMVVAWPGFIGLPPSWQASWAYHYGNVSTVNLSRASVGYVNGNPLMIPVDIIQSTPVCSDIRGYWGDYDDMIMTGFQGTNGIWMRFLTDSTLGCSKRWEYTATTQHVQQSNYVY